MRTLIVAALLATAALAHRECNPRPCYGFDGELGLCTYSAGPTINICPVGDRNVDVDARAPVDRGCMTIAPAYVEVRDTNGTTSATAEFNSVSGGGGFAYAVSTNCTENTFCGKKDENNVTFRGTSYSTSTGYSMYDDKDSVNRWVQGSLTASILAFRQASTLYYGPDQDHSKSFNRGDIAINFVFNSMSWIAPSENLWFLLRISNHGSNPFQMSLSEGDRPVANGVTFFEKAVNGSTYTGVFPTVWHTPETKVVERYELNPINWKYEISQFLAIKLPNAHSQMQYMATISRP